MISCYHLTVSHPGRERPLLDDASIEIDKGAFVEIVGPSGAGKSVLFSLLSLRRAPTGARCIIAGRNLDRLGEAGLAELRRGVGSCAQRPDLLEERSVLENLILPLVARGEHDGALDRVNDLIEGSRLEALCDVPAAGLSDSEVKLAGIYRALVGSPELVLIDGGVEGLADLAEDALSALRRAYDIGSTIVLTSRELSPLDDVRTAALRLSDGKLVSTEDGAQEASLIDGAA